MNQFFARWNSIIQSQWKILNKCKLFLCVGRWLHGWDSVEICVILLMWMMQTDSLTQDFRAWVTQWSFIIVHLRNYCSVNFSKLVSFLMSHLNGLDIFEILLAIKHIGLGFCCVLLVPLTNMTFKLAVNFVGLDGLHENL